MTMTPAWNPPPASCARRAWLTLGARTLLLEDPSSGYFCTSLDLGYPTVRAVTNNRPDDDGIDDRTQYMGERTVTANITALVGAGARIDDVADNFAPFMVPSARPVLHYVLDRAGTAERTITLRPAGYTWKVEGNQQRDIELQWVAPDPYVYDPTVQNVIAWSGSSTASGRVYPLTFPRTYPTGGGTGTTGRLVSNGDLPIQPLCRVYGPVTAPAIHFASWDGVNNPAFWIYFVSGFSLGVNQWVDVDTNNRTAFLQSDPTQPAFAQLNFTSVKWPVLPVAPGYTTISLTGSGAMSGVTQVQTFWQDAFLT